MQRWMFYLGISDGDDGYIYSPLGSVTSRWETFTLGREGKALASGYVYLGGWPKVPGFISGTSDQIGGVTTLVLGLSTLALPVDCMGDFAPRGLSVQYTQDVRGCPPAHTGRPTQGTSVPVHEYTCQHAGPWTQHAGPFRGLLGTLVLGLSTLTLTVDCSGDFGPRGMSVQYTHDVRGTHISTLVLGLSTLALPVDCLGDFTNVGFLFSTHRTSVGVCQHTQDVRGCPSAHTRRPWLSVCVHKRTQDVRGCPPAHTGRPTLVLGLSTLTLPLDCLGDFGPRAVCSVHTGRPWVSVSIHRTSVCVRQHTKVVCGCPCVSVYVRQHTPDVCGCPSYTQDVRGCPPAHTGRPWLYVSTHKMAVAVCVCPSAHTGRLWVSASTHRTSVAIRVCPCVSVRTHMTSVAVHHTHRTSVGVRQHTQNVRVCPSAHKGRPWLFVCFRVCPSVSVNIHMTSVAVRQHTQDVRGCLCVSVCVCKHTQDVRGCPPAHTGSPCVSVCVRQHTHDVRGCTSVILAHGLSVQYTQDVSGCPSAYTGRPCVSVSTQRTSVAVDVCPCVSISTHRTFVAVHQYTYQHVGPWTKHADPSRRLFGTLALPVEYFVDFGPRGLSVQYTQDVRGCPSAHTERPCVSVSTQRASVAVRVCPSVSVNTHMTSVAVPQYRYQHVGPWTQHADPSLGLLRTSVAVRYYQSAHTGRSWLFVCVCVCPCVSVSTYRTSVVVHQYTYNDAGLWNQNAGPSHGLFGTSVRTHRTSVAVRVCVCVCRCVSVSTHKTTHRTSVGVRQHTQDIRGCPWLSVSTHRMSVAVRVCMCVSVSTHRTSVPVHQYTCQHAGPWTQHAGPSRGLLGTLVLGLSTLTLPVDCSGDFGPRGISVQYTQNIRGCPWLSISTHISTLVLGLSTLALPVDCLGDFANVGCLFSTHRTSVGVRQHTQDTVCVRQHTKDIRGCLCVSVCIRLCPSAHTRRPWLSISTHNSTLVLGVSTLAVPVDCSGDFGPRGLSVQYTKDVSGCLSTHTGRPCVSVSIHKTSVCVRVCLCVSVRTHKTSVAVHNPCGLSVQYTQDVRECLPAQTGHPWLSMCLRVCLSVSVSTHRTSVAVHHAHRRSVGVRQHTQDVCGSLWLSVSPHKTSLAVRVCPSEYTGRLWVSASTHRTSVAVRVCPCVSVCVRQPTHDVRGCPSVHISPHCTHRTSVGVRQHKQDIRGCPCVSVYVCLCPSANTGRLWLSISTHISTFVYGLSTLALPVDCLGDFANVGCLFSTHRMSVGVRQHTQDVCGSLWLSVSTHRTSVAVRVCPSAHTGRLWVSASTHRTSVAVRVCPSVSISTHMTSVAVHQYTYQNVGPWTQHAGPSCGLFG
ncbi:hypothetical protein YC2023_066279 [Brassica napus]